jgi:hypothetical protein
MIPPERLAEIARNFVSEMRSPLNRGEVERDLVTLLRAVLAGSNAEAELMAKVWRDNY